MILVISPAIDGLRREWREASANLGASSFQFWRYVGVPVLMPSLLGAMVLLFGNSFSAYATAYGLTGGGVNLAPIQIGFNLSGNVLDNPHIGEALAFGMIVVLAGMMLDLHPTAADLVPVGAMRKRISPSAVLWLCIGAVYFLIPLLAMLIFSLRSGTTGKCCTSRELRGDRRRPRVLAVAQAVRSSSRSRRSSSRSHCSSRPSTGCT